MINSALARFKTFFFIPVIILARWQAPLAINLFDHHLLCRHIHQTAVVGAQIATYSSITTFIPFRAISNLLSTISCNGYKSNLAPVPCLTQSPFFGLTARIFFAVSLIRFQFQLPNLWFGLLCDLGRKRQKSWIAKGEIVIEWWQIIISFELSMCKFCHFIWLGCIWKRNV